MRRLPALLAAALALALTGVAAAAPPDPTTPDPDSLGRTTPEQVRNGDDSKSAASMTCRWRMVYCREYFWMSVAICMPL